MTEQEWLAHLDTFVAQELSVESVRDVFDAMLRRINTLIVAYANREHDDVQQLAKRVDTLRVAIADLRTVAQDHRERLDSLERPHEREAGE